MTQQRMVVTGASGMLGTDMVEVARLADWKVLGLRRSQLDLGDETAVANAVAGAHVVVNCAAYTDVDGAESDEQTALALNADAVATLARACTATGARLVHVSTDYVFDGRAREPYASFHPRNPINAYGRSKAAGERALEEMGANALIVRTAWLYGAHGPCFPRTMARLAAERERLTVVNDQHGQPTWTRDVADLICRLLAADAPAGIYHGTASGQATWREFATAVVESAGLATPVDPVTSAEFPRPAARPAWSVLAHESLEAVGVPAIGPWRDRWLAAAPTVLDGLSHT